MPQSESSSNSPDTEPITRHQIDLTVSLSSIGWDRSREDEFISHANSGLKPGRVARVDGRTVLVITEEGTTRAESSSELLNSAETTEDLPATGDWIGFRPRPSHDYDEIEIVLPRRSQLSRTRQVMKSAVEQQVIATNLDVVFLVHAANNLNLRRLEREASQVAASGAEVVILLNKSDLWDDIEDLLNDVESSVSLVPVYAVSGVTGAGVDALVRYTKPNRTVAFIGASGVGKSTLTNRLLGSDVMDTGAVREDDQRGRHTTTSRHLIPLPDGGALIDTPGMRSLGLSDADEGVETVFEDIVELALSCRFNDCTHSREPGCAIQQAIDQGDMEAERLDSYRKLSREMEFIQSKSDVRLRRAKSDILKARAKGHRKITKAREEFGRPE